MFTELPADKLLWAILGGHEEVKTFDIEKSDGLLIETLLLIGPFEEHGELGDVLDGDNVYIRPYICNPSNKIYHWNILPKEWIILECIKIIVSKYIDTKLIDGFEKDLQYYSQHIF